MEAYEADVFGLTAEPAAVEDLAEGGWVSVERLLAGARRRDGAVWRSDAFDRVMARVRQLKPRPTVLIRGASGTGKSMLARALLDHSSELAGPGMVVDCSTLYEPRSSDLLFARLRAGTADDRRGPVLLDHVSEMPREVQPRIARLLGRRRSRKQGALATPGLIALSNRELGAMAREGRFDPRLHAILAANEIVVPSLSARCEDVCPLVGCFVSQYNLYFGRRILSVSIRALDILMSHVWPGNVRELRNVVESAVLLASGDRIDVDDLKLDLYEQRNPFVAITERPEAIGVEGN